MAGAAPEGAPERHTNHCFQIRESGFPRRAFVHPTDRAGHAALVTRSEACRHPAVPHSGPLPDQRDASLPPLQSKVAGASRSESDLREPGLTHVPLKHERMARSQADRTQPSSTSL